MRASADPGLVKRLSTFASAASVFSIAIGLSELVGWKLGISPLLTWGLDTPTAPNAAGCTILAGVSLWLLRRKDDQARPRASKLAAQTAAVIVSVVGLLTLAEHIFRINFGIDRLLLVGALPAQLAHARILMPPAAAGNFVLFGLALLFIDWRTRRGDWPAQFLCFGAALAPVFGVLSLFLGPKVTPLTVALPAVASYFLLTSGLISSRATWALGGLLTSHSLAARLLRRAVPASLLVLSLIGWFISKPLLTEEHFTWVEVSVLALLASVALVGLIVWTAFMVERSDSERRQAETASLIAQGQLDRDRIDEPESEKELSRKVNWSLAVALLVMGALGMLSWRNAHRAAEDADWVAQTHEVSTRLELTLRNLLDVETGGRGFALSGDQLFLEPYEVGKGAVGQDLDVLRTLIVDQGQKLRLDALVVKANASVKATERLIALRQSSGRVPTDLDLQHTKKIMDESRASVAEMEARQEALLEERTERARATEHFSGSVIAAGSVLGIVFLSIAGFTVNHEIEISARARAQVNALNLKLEQRVAERTAALGESERRLAGVIQSAMDAILTVDEQQTIVMFNGAAEKVFRCAAAEAIGQSLTRFIPQRFQDAHAGHIHKFADTGLTNRIMGAKAVLWAARADGQEFQIEASISQVVAGGRKLFTVILRDVTERVQVEAVREHLASVVDSSDDAIISKDLKGIINGWNRGAEKIFGYSAAEAMGKPMLMLFPPERVNEESDILARIGRGESVQHFETIRVRKDGTKIDVSVTISPIHDGSGAIVGASKVARDITDRKRTEAALQESETNFRGLANLAPQFAWICTNEGLNVYFNERWFKYTGLTAEQSYGRGWSTPFHPDDKQRAWEAWNRATATGETYRIESRLQAADGSYRWFLMLGEPLRGADGSIVKWFGTCIDIHEMKQAQAERVLAERSLYDSEERLRLALEGARLGTWNWDLKTGELVGSPLAFAMFGLPADTKFDFGIFISTLHPNDRAMVDEAMKRTLAEHVGYDVEYRCIWPDGTERWIAAKGRVYRNGAGEPIRVGGIVFDVTERRRSLERLRESEERFQAMANGIPQLAWMAKADGHIFWYNQRWYDYTGTTFDQMDGWAWESVHDPEMLPNVLERWNGSIATGEPFDMEFPLRGADGLFRMFLTRVMPVRDGEGRVTRWFGTNTDISAQKESERQLSEQAQELTRQAVELKRTRDGLERNVIERTEQLAEANRVLERSNTELKQFAYIASHDLQSPLRSIGGFVQLLQMEYEEKLGEQARDWIRRTVKSIAQMQTLIQDLLSFSRVESRSRPSEVVALRDVFQDVMALLESSIRDTGGQVTCDELPTVLGDRSQLVQLMQNLIGNGLKYHGAEAPHVHVSAAPGAKDNEWIVSVRDNGIGIDPKYFERIFEIFKRLHDQKEYPGTGIGLAVCRRVVERHGGAIWVESEPGQGSVFRFSIGSATITGKTERTDENDQLAYQHQTSSDSAG
jgi:PAS domain S-box-containing protein